MAWKWCGDGIGVAINVIGVPFFLCIRSPILSFFHLSRPFFFPFLSFVVEDMTLVSYLHETDRTRFSPDLCCTPDVSRTLFNPFAHYSPRVSSRPILFQVSPQQPQGGEKYPEWNGWKRYAHFIQSVAHMQTTPAKDSSVPCAHTHTYHGTYCSLISTSFHGLCPKECKT